MGCFRKAQSRSTVSVTGVSSVALYNFSCPIGSPIKRIGFFIKMLKKKDLVLNELLKSNFGEDKIDFIFYFKIFWERKLLIICISIFFAVSSVAYALSLPNIYRSSVLLAPVNAEASNGLGQLSGQLGGIASLAGISIGEAGSASMIPKKILTSRKFLGDFIEKHELLVPIMAADGYDSSESTLTIDKDIYDNEKKEWTRKANEYRRSRPSYLEAQEVFREKYFSVSESEETGLVTVSIDFFAPVLSKMWLSEIVLDINEEVRIRDLEKAKNSVRYLEQQLQVTNHADLRVALYQLMESQMKKLMLAEVEKEYAFTIVDPPFLPEEKISPRRSLICLFITTIGVFLSLFTAYFLYLYSSYRENNKKDQKHGGKHELS